jgi:hypothetical protein
MIRTPRHFHLNSSTILHFLFPLVFLLLDSSLPLIDALDKSELGLVLEVVTAFPKPTYLTTFQDYLKRKETLQPEIEDMACKLNITREGLPDHWEQVSKLKISDGWHADSLTAHSPTR